MTCPNVYASSQYEDRAKASIATLLDGTKEVVNISNFINAYGVSANNSLSGSQKFFYNDFYIVRDRAIHSQHGPHGGSYWKLFHTRTSGYVTLSETGKILRIRGNGFQKLFD